MYTFVKKTLGPLVLYKRIIFEWKGPSNGMKHVEVMGYVRRVP